MSREFTTSKNFWLGLLVLNLGIILIGWWQGAGSLFVQGGINCVIAIARLAGLFAAGTILLQFSLIGRNPWLERSFGLDRLIRLHRLNGQFALLFFLGHPLLLIIAYSQLAKISWWAQFVSFSTQYEDVLWAAVAVGLLLVVIGSSITISRRRLRYELWYAVHLIVYVAVYLSFGHQLKNGEDLLGSRWFYTYWLTLYTVILGSHIIFRFIRPLYVFQRHQFKVSRVVRENYNTVSIYITGRDLSQFKVKPGQFSMWRFLTKGRWWQAHPFSISAVPNGHELRLTPKDVGDFTHELPQLQTGASVVIDGPYGIFTSEVQQTNRAVMIAGGIGITPIRAVTEELLQKGQEVILLYANKTESDIVFQTEFDQLRQLYPQFKVIHVLSDRPEYLGEKGLLNQETLQRLVPDIKEYDVYLCGPLPMMNALIPQLKNVGVSHQRLHYEKFVL